MRVALLAALLLAGLSACAGPGAREIESELRARERAWLDAYQADDAAAMSELVADDFTIVYGDGRLVDKAETLGWLDPSRERLEGSGQWTEDTTVRLYGDVAVLSGIYVSRRSARTPEERARYTDTWVRRDGRWQVVASQLTPLPPPERGR